MHKQCVKVNWKAYNKEQHKKKLFLIHQESALQKEIKFRTRFLGGPALGSRDLVQGGAIIREAEGEIMQTSITGSIEVKGKKSKEEDFRIEDKRELTIITDFNRRRSEWGSQMITKVPEQPNEQFKCDRYNELNAAISNSASKTEHQSNQCRTSSQQQIILSSTSLNSNSRYSPPLKQQNQLQLISQPSLTQFNDQSFSTSTVKCQDYQVCQSSQYDIKQLNRLRIKKKYQRARFDKNRNFHFTNIFCKSNQVERGSQAILQWPDKLDERHERRAWPAISKTELMKQQIHQDQFLTRVYANIHNQLEVVGVIDLKLDQQTNTNKDLLPQNQTKDQTLIHQDSSQNWGQNNNLIVQNILNNYQETGSQISPQCHNNNKQRNIHQVQSQIQIDNNLTQILILPSSVDNSPVGARLLNYLREWDSINKGDLIRTGICTQWISQGSPRYLQENKQIFPFRGSLKQKEAMIRLIQSELEEQIIEEVSQESLNRKNPIFCIPKKEDHKWRKIMHYSILNKELKGEHFLMEDVTTLRELIKEKDWAIKIDLQSAFHHIPVNENLKRYLGFQFQERFYQYRAMCFGIKHAPFNLLQNITSDHSINQGQTSFAMRRLLRRPNISQQESSRTKSISFLNCTNSPTIRFQDISREIKFNPNTEIRIPRLGIQHQFKHVKNDIGQKIENDIDNKQMDKHHIEAEIGQNKMVSHCDRQVELSQTTNIEGRSTYETVEQMQVQNLNTKRLEFKDQNAILRTDASKDQWGGTLTILKTGTTEMLNGPWNSNWKLNSSNQREIAAILLGVRRIKENYSNLNLQALRIESDNAAAVYNINRGAAAIALTKMIDHVLEEIEELQMQISARHISGKQNQIANHLFQLAEAGDYSIKDEYLQEALFQMRIKPTIDVFANRCNRKMRRFCSLKEDCWSVKYDGLTIPWASELAYLYPPIALIQRCLNKIMEEKTRVVMLTPFWPAQPWWPDLKRMTIKSMILGESQDLLTLGGRLKRRKRHLPPGSLIISLLEAGWHCIWRRYRQRIGEFAQYWSAIGRQWKDLSQIADPQITLVNYINELEQNGATPACIVLSCIAITVLFKAVGFFGSSINGQILKQTMKKFNAQVKKELKEEPIRNMDLLLSYIKEKYKAIKVLKEQEFFGCTISLIMIFSTLRLAEIHRASCEFNKDKSCSLKTGTEKGPGHKVTITFRRLDDKEI
ncbi:MAG: putative reverse transcriptase [Streblomastix strix]|uniref:Putative reverse transcriptase n=1 Tax=Streblomastix strix TaxID=222440 RepID=A0A5J4VFT8_9EUKA|nr:MAG: putative reverse transcriptase [Streblomastix strix]